MQEPVNVFTNGFPGMGAFPANAGAFGGEGMGLFGAILIGALLTGGFGGFGSFVAVLALPLKELLWTRSFLTKILQVF
ncbi:ORF072 [Escherichia phage T5]|uniref:ORF072 n=1 Tax=Escherichia phage T5 TaxID=2695836 RepID=Q5DMM2_BPT5|nr:ORF072 [Escherichia phage T5]